MPGIAAFFVALLPQVAAQIPGTGNLPAARDTFTFIVAGDNRPASPDSAQPPSVSAIFAAARTLKPSFVVWTGDMIFGLDSAHAPVIDAQYQAYFALARSAGVPVFAAPGNHEMQIKVKHDASGLKELPSAAMQALWRKNMQLPADTPLYGTFTYGNSRFILLNTEEIPPAKEIRSPSAAAGKVNLDPGYVSKAQRKWLEQVLAKNTSAHTFVFMHHPIKPKKKTMGLDQKSADALKALFKQYGNISYVLGSHEHLYYNVQTGDTTSPPKRKDPSKDGAYYLVSGGAGAPLTGTPAEGGFHNYLVFRVAGNRIDASLVRLP